MSCRVLNWNFSSPPYVCDAKLPIRSICAKFSVPTAKNVLPDTDRDAQCATGKLSFVIPDGFHSSPAPEKWLRAPVTRSDQLHSRGRYSVVV